MGSLKSYNEKKIIIIKLVGLILNNSVGQKTVSRVGDISLLYVKDTTDFKYYCICKTLFYYNLTNGSKKLINGDKYHIINQ